MKRKRVSIRFGGYNPRGVGRAYLERVKNLFIPSGVVWPLNEAAGRIALDVGYRIISLEMLDNPGFEIAGAGGADIWASWIETVGDGALADEGTLVHGGSHAAKLTGGATANTFIRPAPTPRLDNTIDVLPGSNFELTFWTRGDGTNQGRYNVVNVNQGGFIRSTVVTGVTGAAYQKVTHSFVIPSGCYQISVSLLCSTVNGGVCYFDDVSLICSDYPMSGVYPASGVTYGQPGIGDGGLAAVFDGNDSPVKIGSRAFNTLWNGDKFSALTWAKVDSGARWTDATTYRYSFHVKSRPNATVYAVLGKSNANHQLIWRRRIAGLTNEHTYTFAPTGPLGWFCMGMTVDVSKPKMCGYLYVPGSLDWFKVFDVAGDGLPWDKIAYPVDDSNTVLFGGSATAQEWIGAGALVAYKPGLLSDDEMQSAMVP